MLSSAPPRLDRTSGRWPKAGGLGTKRAKLYQSGFYVQSARLVDCEAERCHKAGFLCKNQEVGGLALIDCWDTSSAYSLVIEYAGNRAKVEGFVSDGATRRALQMIGNDAEVGIEIRNFTGDGRPVLLGATERLELVDAPGTCRGPEAVPGSRLCDEGQQDPDRHGPADGGRSGSSTFC